MLNPKLILFDVGGVLIEYQNVFSTPAKEQNISIDAINNTFDKYDTEITKGHITPQELWVKILKDNHLTADEDYDFLNAWLKDYEIIKPTFDLVFELSKKYNVGLLSNIYKGMVPIMLEKELLPNIDYKYKFLSCELGKQKPDKEIYEYIQEETRLKPEDILFIDDREDYRKEPKELGWNVYAFPRNNPEQGVKDIKDLLGL